MRVFKQRYNDRKGRTKLSEKWYTEFKDHTETVRRVPGFTDKKATEELGRRLEKLVSARVLGESLTPELARWLERAPSELRDRLERLGLVDPRTVAGGKPLAGHLHDFRRDLLNRGDTEEHAKLVTSRARKVCEGCRFVYFSDMKATAVQQFLADLRSGKRKLSNQTSNFYLQAVKQFCRWAVKDGRLLESPVAHLEGVNVRLDRRHDRRSLTVEELTTLLTTTAAGPVRHRITGRDRAMLYRTASETGLRRNELGSLTPQSIDFAATPPVVYVLAKNTKNRKAVSQVIRPELAAELRRWIQDAEIAPERPLWPDMTANTSLMLQKDLKAAGIAYVDESGRYADFHALRHSYITLITQGGVNPKLAQRLARHSSVELTLGRYSHTLLTDEAEALQVLPQLPSLFDSPDSERQALRATGTDGKADPPASVLPSGLPETGAPVCISLHRSKAETEWRDRSRKASASLETPDSRRYDTSGEVTERPNVPVSKTDSQSPEARSSKALRSTAAPVLPACLPESGPIDRALARVLAAWPSLPEPLRRAVLALVEAQAEASTE